MRTINLYSVVERAVFRLKGSFSAVLSSFYYSRETHPPGSDSHGCLTLHFAKNRNEHRAKSLNPTLPTSVFSINSHKLEKGFMKVLSCLFLIILWTTFFLSLPAPHADAFQVRVLPSRIYPGDAFMVRVSGLKKAVEPSALFNDKPLHFSSCGKGCFIGLGAFDLSTKPGVYRMLLKVGKQKTMLRMRVLKDRFETINLTLPEEKVSPSPENILRIEKEADLLNSIWQIDSERLWEGNFLLPLQNPLSTPFGTKRIINMETISIHKGLDMKGQEGEGIKASNKGRVVLTEELFFGGNTIILDHGQGIFTVYMHMSGFIVSPGDLVPKNDIIGFVGSTGRSSGPHLHFGVKVTGINANPVSLTDLKL